MKTSDEENLSRDCHQGEVVEHFKVSVEHESSIAAICGIDAIELPLWGCVWRAHILWLIDETNKKF